MKAIKITIILAISSIAAIMISSGQTSALTYQSTVSPEFTISPAISVSMSESDLVINDLNPGTSSDSNIITITASSNSLGGYSLSSTVGSSTTNYTDLRLTSSDTTNKFTNLDSNKATLNNFDDNYWGYSYSTDDGTSWVSGDINDNPLTGYNGLPVYSNTGIKLVDSNTLGTSTIKFKIGAKASISQASGAYTNTVNFVTVANPTPAFCDSHTCMQDLTSSTIAALLPNVGDTATVYDARDEQSYTVGKLADNNYWMLDNLALDLTDVDVQSAMYNSTDTKTNASYTTLGYLFNGGGSTSDQYATSGVITWPSSSYSYSVPWINMASKNTVPSDATSTAGGWKIGGYYNYCAASAGSYCYGNGTSYGTSSGNATEDICPKGWRMPTGGSGGKYQTLYNNSSYNTYAKYRAALHLPLSGSYYSGSASSQGSSGDFWSSIRYDSSYMYNLYLTTSSVGPASRTNRDYGYSLRCVLSQ